VAGHRRAETGFSLIEVLVATAIMGTAIVALVFGMGTLLDSSSQNRQATTATIVARDYVEALDVAVAQPNAWCASSYSVSYTPPSGYTVTPTVGSCPANTATTPQFQTVSVAVAGPSSSSANLTVVVREP
jgi:prepilin-type N-terminal cleavage/methylation domain-containing protein